MPRQAMAFAKVWRVVCISVLCASLAACARAPDTASTPYEPDQSDRIAALAADILALDAGIAPFEAQQAARIAITYPMQLRAEYQVTDPPILHNMKVNSGLRPRGLCFHWADDLQKALTEERFETISLHRAIANSGRVFRIEHSTVIVSAKGAAWNKGLVLDPWRFGGTLYWGPPALDKSYRWEHRDAVFAQKRQPLR